MFTGLVQTVGEVVVASGGGDQARTLVVRAADLRPPAVGDSVAVDGCCLTVVAYASGEATFEAATETQRRTTLAGLQAGTRVNLEPALRVGDALGGHWVTGHVDAVGTVRQRREEGSATYLRVQVPAPLMPLCAARGSIALAGVSLTICGVGPEAVEVALIPHTLASTTLGEARVGAPINLEADLLARHIAHLMAHPAASGR